MGHIQLVSLYLIFGTKGIPSESVSCSISSKQLERVLYFAAYVMLVRRDSIRIQADYRRESV